MSSSILTSVKKVLNIDESFTIFDPDLILQINGVFVTLNQLGIGPVDGFQIEDKTVTWEQYLPNTHYLNLVKTYVCLVVRVRFDPPTSSFLLTSLEKQIQELEWRLNVDREYMLYQTEEA